MEYVGGKDLRAIFDRARKRGESVPVPMACYTAMKVCEGLDYAHNKKDAAGREVAVGCEYTDSLVRCAFLLSFVFRGLCIFALTGVFRSRSRSRRAATRCRSGARSRRATGERRSWCARRSCYRL